MPHNKIYVGSLSECYLEICSVTGKIEQVWYKKQPCLVSKPQDANKALVYATDNLYTITQAWGCDECFPSIAGGTLENSLRDHGIIWEKSCQIPHHSHTSATFFWEPYFTRHIAYKELTSGHEFVFSVTFPKYFNNLLSIYASHALFAAHTHMRLTILDKGQKIFSRTFPESQKKEALKFFCEGEHLEAHLVTNLGTFIIKNHHNLNYLGIWWCNNGWGDGREHRTLGIEPTNFPSDGPIVARARSEHEPSEFVTSVFSWIFPKI